MRLPHVHLPILGNIVYIEFCNQLVHTTDLMFEINFRLVALQLCSSAGAAQARTHVNYLYYIIIVCSPVEKGCQMPSSGS